MVIEIDGGGGGGGGGGSGGKAAVYERDSGGVGAGIPGDQLNFDHRGSWGDTLPDADHPYGPAPNKLMRYQFGFDTDSLTTNTNRFDIFNQAGTGLLQSYSGGELQVTANAEFCSETYNTGHHPTAPFYSSMIRVENIDLNGGTFGTAGNAADTFIGVVNSSDQNAMIVGGYNASVDRFEVFTRDVNGNTNANSIGGSVSTITQPFDMLVTLAGDECWVATREVNAANPEWVVQGSATFGSNLADFYDNDIWGPSGGNWTNCFRFAIGGSRSVTVSDYEVFQGMGLGLRDPHPITYKDGGPLIDDGKLWLTGTAGSAQARGYCLVYTLDTRTLEIELKATLFANPENASGNLTNYISNYVAPHIMYNEDRDRFTVLWSAFGNGANDPRDTYANRPVFVTHTDRDIRHGVHRLRCDPANLPGSGGKHDAFVVYDSAAGKWRCVHNSNLINEISLSETTDDNLTSGWSVLGSHSDATNDIEGATIAKIDGEYIIAAADPTQTTDVGWFAYGDDEDRVANPMDSLGAVNLDRVPGDPDAPWGVPIPIPYDDDKTKYLFVTMDETTRGGFGNSSAGALQFYLSQETEGPGYEYPHRKLVRPY